MIIECPDCRCSFEDCLRSTICPHQTFAANDGQNNFAHHPEAYLSPLLVGCLNCGKDYDRNTQGSICPHEGDGRRKDSLPLWPKPTVTAIHRSASEMVREFHQNYEVPILSAPGFPSHDRCKLRQNILEEEWIEFCEAHAKRDLVEVADALADMLYIIHGMALEYGIPLDAVVEEVHRSNMSKLDADGRPIRRADGKVMKGPAYFKPDIAKVLGL